jgi:hypothetical protein
VLVGLAERRGLRLTVGHHFQFSHAARRVRSLIRQGPAMRSSKRRATTVDLGERTLVFLGSTGTLPGGLSRTSFIARRRASLASTRGCAHGFVSPALLRLGADVAEARGPLSTSKTRLPRPRCARSWSPGLGAGYARREAPDGEARGRVQERGAIVPPIIFAKQHG